MRPPRPRSVMRGAGAPVVLAFASLALLAACTSARAPVAGAYPTLPRPQAARPGAPQAVPTDRRHTVVPGDTVYAVARRYGLGVRALIEENNLVPPYVLVVGRPLRLPSGREHVVVAGDTVYGISRRYGIDMAALVRANRIAPPYTIKVGQRLRLPDGTAAARPATQVVALPAPRPTPPGVVVPRPKGGKPGQSGIAGPAPANPAPTATLLPPPRAGTGFLWPVRGPLLSSFGAKKGGRHNDGVNIAAERGVAVVAAENGVVAYAGNELRGFGNLLLIRHADGWVSAYAHNETLLVKRGDKVRRGQPIARIGSTGSVSRPQLHFELRRGTEAVDPLRHLANA